jgi:hypothetical protein
MKDKIYQYAVKVIQGGIQVDSKIKPIGIGSYFTSVNVHNPLRHNVKYAVKMAVSGSNGKTSTISNFHIFKIGPDAVTEFDSMGFSSLLGGALPPFLEGYFVIESEEELDVVGIYTGGEIKDGSLEALHMERVPARVIPICKDLKMDISTAVAPWSLTIVPNGSTAPMVVGGAPISNPACSPWLLPAIPKCTAKWIGTSGDTGTGGVKGDYTYELSFCLCWSFQTAQIKIDMLWADNTANIFLNDSPALATTPDTWLPRPANTTLNITDPAMFKIGMNKLRVVVTNKSNGPTGMFLSGTLTAIAADCIS